MGLSVNELALPVVKELVDHCQRLGIIVEKTAQGTTIIDAGSECRGGLVAGKLITEVCMGGLGGADITNVSLDDLVLPAISVYTDSPAVSLLGSQFAGWRISVGRYTAMGSGPARALSLKPRDLFDRIDYRDSFHEAVIVLEASTRPNEEAVAQIAEDCHVSSDKLYVILVPTQCLAGSTQIAGRVAETGLHKMTELGFDPKRVISGYGVAPIAPVHPKMSRAMGRTNDMIIYGGKAYFTVEAEDDEALKMLVEKVPSSTSRDYGRPFADIFRAAGHDFYKIDSSLFAPATITVSNKSTGSTFTAGRVNSDVLRLSIS
jgi:methenyltetrahydromethanopterin cyclohydrolase